MDDKNQSGAEPPLSGAHNPLDLLMVSSLAELLGSPADDHRALHELLTMFASDCERLLAELDEAVLDNDVARVQYVAHTLGGSSASLGARRLTARCHELEDCCRSGRVDRERTADVRAAYTEALAALKEALPL